MNIIFTNFKVKLNSCIRIANKKVKSDNHLRKSIAVHFQFLELSYFCDCIHTSFTTRSLPVEHDLKTRHLLPSNISTNPTQVGFTELHSLSVLKSPWDAKVNSASIFYLLLCDYFHTSNSHNENTATLEKCTWEEATSNLFTSVAIFHFSSFHGYPLFTLLKYRQNCKFSQYPMSFCNFIVVHLATTSFRQSLRRLSGNR